MFCQSLDLKIELQELAHNVKDLGSEDSNSKLVNTNGFMNIWKIANNFLNKILHCKPFIIKLFND